MSQKYFTKAKDSFNTKKKIFLYALSLSNRLKANNKEPIKAQFKGFDLKENLDIVNSYARVYYQKNYAEKIDGIKTVQQVYEEILHWENENKALLKEIEIEYTKTDFFTLFPKDKFEDMLNQNDCGYCGITKEEINLLRNNEMLLNKHDTRGYSLEIDRKEPNLEYTPENCIMSCYWCNNAKTDEFNEREFKIIAKSIKKVWNSRLAKVKIVGSEINPYMEKLIKKSLDAFFNKNSNSFKNIAIFKEIFELLEDSNFKKNNPIQYEKEIKRIRDLKNIADTATENL